MTLFIAIDMFCQERNRIPIKYHMKLVETGITWNFRMLCSSHTQIIVKRYEQITFLARQNCRVMSYDLWRVQIHTILSLIRNFQTIIYSGTRIEVLNEFLHVTIPCDSNNIIPPGKVRAEEKSKKCNNTINHVTFYVSNWNRYDTRI